MSEIKTNKISPRRGTTTTIGDSGDSVTISSGTTTTNAGTISTAGITGGTINNTTGTIEGLQQQVSWQTGDIKTAAFTAVANEGYFCNTTSAAFTVTLPASPSAGDVIAFKDYADTFDTNNLTLDANGNKIQGSTTNFDISVEGTAAVFLYIDSTQGWKLVDQSKAADIAKAPVFISATGGTITTCGDFKIHQFTSPGTFTVSTVGNAPTVPTGGPDAVDYLVVAGGGGGGRYALGGGGAGGFRLGSVSPCATTPLSAPGLTITATSFPITVGGGGTGGTQCTSSNGCRGSNSVFSTITSTGGGGGGNFPPSTPTPTDNSRGGSGGAIGRDAYLAGRTASNNGNLPPVSPPQGNDGGVHVYPSCTSGSRGGGGAGGAVSPGGPPAPGGNAAPVTPLFGASPQPFYTGSPANGSFAGGGGGATFQGNSGSGGGSSGGTASNISASPSSPAPGGNGQTNTGGGGGGEGPGQSGSNGGAGGSGIVIIRYKYQ